MRTVEKRLSCQHIQLSESTQRHGAGKLQQADVLATGHFPELFPQPANLRLGQQLGRMNARGGRFGFFDRLP